MSAPDESTIDDLPKSFLDCRDRGHAWFDPKDGPAVRRTGGGAYVRRFVCPRCKTERSDIVVGRTGEILPGTRRYAYRKGYLTPGRGRVDKSMIRALALKATTRALRRVS